MFRSLTRFFDGKQTTPRPGRDVLRSDLFASLDAAINHARTGLSAREIADHLEQQTGWLRVADAIARPVL